MPSSSPPASLARRAMPAVVLAGTSVLLLTQLDKPAPSLPAAGRGTGDVGTAGANRTAPLPNRAGPTAAPAPTAAPSTDGPAAPASTVPAAPAACTGKPVTGPIADTRWGPVQVAAVLDSSGAVCDVEALQSPNDHGRSIAINDYALPILHDRAVAAKGTGFQAVSGATITSEGYRASLQAILDGA